MLIILFDILHGMVGTLLTFERNIIYYLIWNLFMGRNQVQTPMECLLFYFLIRLRLSIFYPWKDHGVNVRKNENPFYRILLHSHRTLGKFSIFLFSFETLGGIARKCERIISESLFLFPHPFLFGHRSYRVWLYTWYFAYT